jgi:hypothetical protein
MQKKSRLRSGGQKASGQTWLDACLQPSLHAETPQNQAQVQPRPYRQLRELLVDASKGSGSAAGAALEA